jgi:hypothetical protein
MTPFQSTCVIIFAIIAYLIITDRNVADYLTLVFKMTKLNIERFFWMIRLHPNNFITTWIQNRKYDKMAKELMKEIKS